MDAGRFAGVNANVVAHPGNLIRPGGSASGFNTRPGVLLLSFWAFVCLPLAYRIARFSSLFPSTCDLFPRLRLRVACADYSDVCFAVAVGLEPIGFLCSRFMRSAGTPAQNLQTSNAKLQWLPYLFAPFF